MQSNINRKTKFKISDAYIQYTKVHDTSDIQFYKLCLPLYKLPVLSDHAWQMTNLFGSTFISVHLFSKTNIVNNRTETVSMMRD
jgi:hypothetical protein